MSVWAVLPQKSFDRGKSRLKPALSDHARRDFARALFEHVLDVLGGAVDGILVCTDSPEVADVAMQQKARVLFDAPSATTLAAIVDAGLNELASRGAGSALVLMADLPRLTAADVRHLIAPLAAYDLVMVRAQDGRHTNALAISPPGCLPTSFGRADSFEAHIRTARAARLRVCVLENAHVAFDVDDPQDHAALIKQG